jgi:hypothetical protein
MIHREEFWGFLEDQGRQYAVVINYPLQQEIRGSRRHAFLPDPFSLFATIFFPEQAHPLSLAAGSRFCCRLLR